MLMLKLNKLLLMFTLALSLAVQAEDNSNQNEVSRPHYLSMIAGNSDATVNSQSFNNDYSGAEYTYFYSPQYGIKAGSVSSSSGFDFSTFQSYDTDSFYLAFTARTKEGKLFAYSSLGFAQTDETYDDPFACLFCPTNPPVHVSSTGLYWDVGVGFKASHQWDLALGFNRIQADISDLTNSYLIVSFRF